MSPEAQGALTRLRHALLHLHKTLLDWERAGYERRHGRVSSHQLLQAILKDPQFAWLRPLSELIVRLDEVLENEAPVLPGDLDVLVAQVRALVSPAETSGEYGERYREALQQHPDAVVAHRDVVLLLKRTQEEGSLPAQRLH